MLSQGSLFIIFVVEPHHVIGLPAPRPQQADDGDEEECGDQGGEAAEGECGASHGRVETADLANTNDTWLWLGHCQQCADCIESE